MSVVNKPCFFSHAIRTEVHSCSNIKVLSACVCVCNEWVFGGQDKTCDIDACNIVLT